MSFSSIIRRIMRAITALAAVGTVSSSYADEFTLLPRIPVLQRGHSGQLNPLDVSDDGNTVVGYVQTNPEMMNPFVWRRGVGLKLLENLGGRQGQADVVSGDGRVIAGYSYARYPRAFRWDETTGMENLGTLGGVLSSGASEISADGNVIVGIANNEHERRRVFRWTRELGMEDLGVFQAYTDVSGVSADGTVIVGQGWTWEDDAIAYRYSDATGYQALAAPGRVTFAGGISADGTTIVGLTYVSGRSRPGYWRNGSAFIELPFPTPAGAWQASPDGSQVLGGSDVNRQVIWRLDGSWQYVRDIYGFKVPPGWLITYCKMSRNWRYMTGSIEDLSGKSHSFVLDTQS